MTNRKDSAGGRKGGLVERYTRVENALHHSAGNLWSLAIGEPGDFVGINIKQRGEYDWVVVVKKVGDDGTPLVAFGSGQDFVDALLAANAALAADRWRPDRPFDPER